MFGFGRSSKSAEELLEQSESTNKDDRLDAVEQLGELDENHPEVQNRLQFLEKNDKEKKIRKAAGSALKNLKKKPMGDPLFGSSSATAGTGGDDYSDDDVPDAEMGGSDGTAFDDKVGDSSLEQGEMDVESDLSKEEEDRREQKAEGKGIWVTIKERNSATLSYQGQVQEKGTSSGLVEVRNTGTQNRINGIDLYLEDVDNVNIEQELVDGHIAIGMIRPGNFWESSYDYETDFDVIEVSQDFSDPETELSPNFLGGAEKQFENRITITNTLDTTIVNLRGKKILNENASLVETSGENVEFNSAREEITESRSSSSNEENTPEDTGDEFGDSDDDEFGNEFDDNDAFSSSGETSTENEETTRTADVVNFLIEEIAPGETVEIVITLKASLPDDVPAYTAGGLNVTYDVKDNLTSGLQFKSVDGVSDIKQRIRKKQRETEPNLYDAEVTFENKSEFVYNVKEFEVREGGINGEPILEWIGADHSEDEREIVPGERTVFEFVYEDKDGDGNPAFGQHLEFEVQEYHSIAAEYSLDLPVQDLKFMALEIRKAYLDENDEETKEFNIPSYVETKIPSRVWVTGVGTYPLDNVEIVEEIPEGFGFCQDEEVKIFRNGQELPAEQYEIVYGAPEGPEGDEYTSSIDVESGQNGLEEGESDTSTSEPVTKADLAGGSRMQINLYNLQDTEDGPFGEGEEITVDYYMVADHLEPRDDPIKTYAFTEGYINDMPESRVHDEISSEDELIFNVIHLRDDIDIGKYVSAISHDGQNAYDIELEAENYGTSTKTLTIVDLVPTGFELVDGSMSSDPELEVQGPEAVEEGQVYTWVFEDVAPEGSINVSFKLVQSAEDANPRLLQKVYQG